MAKNIEIKARLDDISIQRRIIKDLADSGPTLIQQEDTFFNTSSGRLKLRIFSDRTGELISYHRANQTGPKASEYFIFKTDNPAALKKTLEHSLGIIQTVKKIRELYLMGRTRIHLDQVEQLGNFLEIEVVLKEIEDPKNGIKEAENLMDKLQISRESLIDKAYVDLLLQSKNNNTE